MKNAQYCDRNHEFISCDLDNGSNVSFSAVVPNEWLDKFLATKQVPSPWVDPVTPQEKAKTELSAVDLHEIVAGLLAAADPKVIEAMPEKAKAEITKLTELKAQIAAAVEPTKTGE